MTPSAAAPGRESGIARCLVTGVAGFIGSHLAERLLMEGYEVVGIDCLTDYYSDEAKRENLRGLLARPHFSWLREDLNEADLPSLLKGIDWVFHLAGQPGVRGSWGSGFSPYVRNNVEATQKLLEAVRTSSVSKFVYASSSSVYGRMAPPMIENGRTQPYSPYGVTKLTAEHLCLLYARNFGLPITAVRYFTVFGPRQRPDMAFSRFLQALLDGRELPIYGDGKQTRDFTYVGDAVEGTVLAARRGVAGEVYNLGGGCPAALLEAVHAMERATSRTGCLRHTAAQDGDVVDTLADTTKARGELGFKPMVSLEEGIKLQARWEQERRKLVPMPASSRATSSRRRIAARDSQAISGGSPRVLIYSHDTFGLGHLRRNLAIAGHLLTQCKPRFSVALLTGSPVALSWPMPTGLEVLPLPPVVKTGAEQYAPRDGAETFAAVKTRREAVILDALHEYRPDIFLVDHAPAGMKGELLQALAFIRKKMPETRTVLGLRDILDSPPTVRELWQEQGIYTLLEKTYDQILVYGSRHLFDVVRGYYFSKSLEAKTKYCGYIARNDGEVQAAVREPGRLSSDRPMVLVTAGGGGDGYFLMDGYLRSLNNLKRDAVHSILVPGPLMAADERQALARASADRADVQIIDYTTEMVGLIRKADLVVSMCGYNTTAEILAARKPAILVPRVAPRAEQRLRASVLGSLGLAWVVQPDEDLAAHLADLIPLALTGSRPLQQDWDAVDLGGVRRVAESLVKLLPRAWQEDEVLLASSTTERAMGAAQ